MEFITDKENAISYTIITEAIQVHKGLGPGLLEKVYSECLYYRLIKLGLHVEKERPIPVIYEEVRMDCGYRADLYIENCLLVEIKSIDAIADIHISKALTYMRFLPCRLGLILNFNVVKLSNGGIKRVVLTK